MENLFIVLTVSIALSYGWGMRGSLIGSERGALLPGALLGMFLALFSGSQTVADNFWFFAAAGAVGMAYGGAQTYGQTLGFIVHRGKPDYAPAKGYAGVAIKGGLWHGIDGAVLGIMFSAAGGYYKPLAIIIFFALIPVMQAIGVTVFNKPYKPKEGRFPKIYFSIDRREEWGGNLVTLIGLLIFTLLHKDYYAFFFAVVGLFGGAAGFSLGMVIYDFMHHPMKNGRYFFGSFNDKLSGWKTMELTFGAVGGIFFAVYFVLTKDTMLKERIDVIEANGGITDFTGSLSAVLPWIFVALVIITKAADLFADKLTSHGVDLIQRPFIFILPMILTLLGNPLAAQFTAFSLIVFFAVEEAVFDRMSKFTGAKKIIVTSALVIAALASVICQAFISLPIIVYILMYTIFYIVTNNIMSKHYGDAHITVTAYFLLQTAYLTAVILSR